MKPKPPAWSFVLLRWRAPPSLCRPGTSSNLLAVGLAIVFSVMAFPINSIAASAALIGWSVKGLNETAGSDFSVFSLNSPGGTIRAQFIRNGLLVTNDYDVFITYEAIADANGSINSTAIGKNNFPDFAEALHGFPLGIDQGLDGFGMPGFANDPQPMAFDPVQGWFYASGIPITPIDDQGLTNPYPMLRLVARNSAGAELASTDITVPVSDGLNCRACHTSGSQTVARPNGGWVWDCDPDRDYKLNVLQKHDDRHLGSEVYSNVLQQAGYDNAGLFVTATRRTTPIHCVRCHPSNDSPGSGQAGMRPLTLLLHAKHSYVNDPVRGLPLSFFNDSAVCLTCHSGPESKFLRGAHRQSVKADGQPGMQCQSCHGNLLNVGSDARQGWVDQPNCQSCHTGNVRQNNGQVRYTSAFEATGRVRQAVNQTFATQLADRSQGLSPFSHSQGHGNLKCAACHGPAHGEWPSKQPNENIQSQRLQASRGTLLKCIACHTSAPVTVTGGPHGMHSVSQYWVEKHHDLMGNPDIGGHLECRACHGNDFRGAVLSKAGIDGTYSGRGTHQFWRGFQVGCYDCHNSPTVDTQNTNRPPVVTASYSNARAGDTIAIPLSAVDPEGRPLTYRIVSQPTHGRVSLSGSIATFFADTAYVGTDSFTFSSNDGQTDSNLETATVDIAPGDCALSVLPLVPRAAMPGKLVSFQANATLTRCDSAIAYEWEFGDGSPSMTEADACHAYNSEGDYSWTLTVTIDGLVHTTNGIITTSTTLGPPLQLAIENWFFQMNLSWPIDEIPTALESSTDPTNPYSWIPVYDPPWLDPFSQRMNVPVFILPDQQYFRLRRVP